MYPTAITCDWKANSGGRKDNPGSMSDVDELFKLTVMLDNIRSLKRNLNGTGMLYNTYITIYILHRWASNFHGRFYLVHILRQSQ